MLLALLHLLCCFIKCTSTNASFKPFCSRRWFGPPVPTHAYSPTVIALLELPELQTNAALCFLSGENNISYSSYLSNATGAE